MNLYHGSSHKISGPLQPVLINQTPDHVHDKPAVFATEREDLAGLFMFPTDHLASIGFEEDISYICIWGKIDDFKDRPGYMYIFSSDNFIKEGKKYEWQSYKKVTPKEVKTFDSVITGMIDLGIQVYFINNDQVFDKIVEDKFHRAPLLKNLVSENQIKNRNIKKF